MMSYFYCENSNPNNLEQMIQYIFIYRMYEMLNIISNNNKIL